MPIQTSCMFIHTIQTPAQSLQKTTSNPIFINRPSSRPTSHDPAIAVIERKRTAAGPSLMNMFKSAAVDLQLAVIPGGRSKDWSLRSKDKRDHTPPSLQESNSISPHAK